MNLVLLKSLSLFTKEEAVIRNLPGGYVTFHTFCGEAGSHFVFCASLVLMI